MDRWHLSFLLPPSLPNPSLRALSALRANTLPSFRSYSFVRFRPLGWDWYPAQAFTHHNQMPINLVHRDKENGFESLNENHLTPLIIWLASAGLVLIGVLFATVCLCKRIRKRQRVSRERKDMEAGMNKVLSFPERERESEQRSMVESMSKPGYPWGAMSTSSLLSGPVPQASVGIERQEQHHGRENVDGAMPLVQATSTSTHPEPSHIHLPVHHGLDGTQLRAEYDAQKAGKGALPTRTDVSDDSDSESFEIVEVDNDSFRSANSSIRSSSTINTVYRFHYPTLPSMPHVKE
ncbi:hypothetical protein D9758_013198 [Tetrapyrgos nigripes]|uniref:Uncharacterized protein n=1 Tax=Tetrapyrgos nigripes TaxID=182062 RepID=A0A8H5CRR6_9AGAR|nr:hypothetical protein D9758_013198 [Tetrapyrgos nigripes]